MCVIIHRLSNKQESFYNKCANLIFFILLETIANMIKNNFPILLVAIMDFCSYPNVLKDNEVK